MTSVAQDQRPFGIAHGSATRPPSPTGDVKMPNDPLMEAMDMRDAQRAYEANLNVIDTAKAMQNDLIDLLKK